MTCPACGDSPTMGSSDGNMKCTRRKCAGSVRKEKNKIAWLINIILFNKVNFFNNHA